MTPLRLDLVVGCKPVSRLNAVSTSHVLTFLRLTTRPLALIINFGEKPLSRAVRRVVNGIAD